MLSYIHVSKSIHVYLLKQLLLLLLEQKQK